MTNELIEESKRQNGTQMSKEAKRKQKIREEIFKIDEDELMEIFAEETKEHDEDEKFEENYEEKNSAIPKGKAKDQLQFAHTINQALFEN